MMGMVSPYITDLNWHGLDVGESKGIGLRERIDAPCNHDTYKVLPVD